MSEHEVPLSSCIMQMVMKVIMLILLNIAFGALALAGSQAPAKNPIDTNTKRQLVLDAKVTILESPDAPGPVQKAAEDLAADFEKVLGKKPRIINREEDAGPVTILVGEQSNLPEDLRPADLTAPESFSISVTTPTWNKTRPSKVVLLAGADMRG